MEDALKKAYLLHVKKKSLRIPGFVAELGSQKGARNCAVVGLRNCGSHAWTKLGCVL
jgi:hypothetical protein